MKLYHYTSVKSFKKIWENQSRKFSDSRKTNDVFEKRKLIQVYSVTFPEEYKPNSKGFPFFKHFYDILYSYRQISLCSDYNNGLKGYASPMMWGQYANSSKGICIELDSDKLDLNKTGLWAAKVEYTEKVPEIVFDGCMFRNDDDINLFIENNANDIFFKKHFHWQYENEYRIISNSDTYLPIWDAITAVYVPNDKGYAFRIVDKLLEGSEIILRYMFPITSKGGRKLSYMDVETARRCKKQFEEKKTFTTKEIIQSI